nr:radical SAM protein [Methanothermus fervidus]
MKCKICGESRPYISKVFGICKECILEGGEAIKHVRKIHGEIRKKFNLPPEPPKDGNVKCNICSNKCRMKENEVGYCGLRMNIRGKLRSLVSDEEALLYTYLDPIPTNCCAAWFCPGCTGRGYPKYAYKNGPEYGFYNLASFFYGCNFDCVYCQNISHKNLWKAPKMTIEKFVNEVKNEKITCICYFGGSPEPQLPFAIKASKEALKLGKKILRICWEWNGCGNEKLVKRAAKIAGESGGIIKFDLKCFDENLSIALSGVSNKQAYKNFKMIGEKFFDRYDIPVLTATTLLVPGYVDKDEVRKISKFIAEINDEIPYQLLVFHPDYMMMDLPITPRKQVYECFNEAKKYLKNVDIGNIHLIT